MAVKNNRRTIITKKILKDSLLELMQTKPISKITIKEICDLSNMSRSTFYLHYQDQSALLEDTEKGSRTILHGYLNIIVDWINNDFNLKPHKPAEIIYHICNIIVT